MSPEALARLREGLEFPYFDGSVRVGTDDLRALLAAYENARDSAKAQQSNARSLGYDIAKLVGYVVRNEDGDALRAAVEAVVRERDDLRVTVDAARNHSTLSSAPCPLCTYENGKFVRSCKPHEELFAALAERDEINARHLQDECTCSVASVQRGLE